MTVFVVLAAAVVIFTIISFVPGDPVKILLGAEATPEEILAQRTQLGLEDSYLVQLGKFMYNAFIKFDLGDSWVRGVPVVDGLSERLPRTIFLGLSFVILSSSIAIPLGVTAAVHQNKWQDRVSTVIAMICISIPNFWLAMMMILLFSLKLGWLPSFGIGGPEYYVMPIIAGALRGIGGLTRQTRSSMLEVIRSDFVTTARAKGLKENKVIWQHMLPNALIPIITILGQSIGMSVAGTVIIEQVFSLPGVGTYLTGAVMSRDYPIIRGCVILLAGFMAILMLFVDLVYAYVDPRIKAQYRGQTKRRKVKENG